MDLKSFAKLLTQISLFFVLLGLDSALEPCSLFILDAHNLSVPSNYSTYQTMSEIANHLSQITANPDNSSCSILGVIVYPGDYMIEEQLSINGNLQSYSIIFNASSADTPAGGPLTSFTFQNQSNLLLENFIAVQFRDITLVFGNQSTNSLTIMNVLEVSILNMNLTESQPNSGTDPQIKIVQPTKLTIYSVNINSLLSPNFFAITGNKLPAAFVNITNLVIEYAITQANQNLFSQINDPCALLINSSLELKMTNISVVSPKDNATGLPITTSFLSKVIYIVDSNDTTISGLNVINFTSNYNDYRYLFNLQNTSYLLVENIKFAGNELNNLANPRIFDIVDVKVAYLNEIEISQNFLSAPSAVTASFFTVRLPATFYSGIMMKDVLIENMPQVTFLSLSGAFAVFNISNFTARNLGMKAGTLFDIDIYHKTKEYYYTWFSTGIICYSYMEDILFDNITFNRTSSSFINFRHSIRNSNFEYLTYGEAVSAVLQNVTFSKVTAIQSSGSQSGLIFFNGVKGTVNQVSLLDSALTFQNFLVSLEASLVVDALNMSNVSLSGAFTIYQNANFAMYSAQLYRTSNYEIYYSTSLPLYRVFSVQNSNLQGLNLTNNHTLMLSNMPFFLLANNTFTNMTISKSNGIISIEDKALFKFPQFNFLTFYAKSDTFVGRLLGPEILRFAVLLVSFTTDVGYNILVSENAFSSIVFSEESNLLSVAKGQDINYHVLLQYNILTEISGKTSTSGHSGFMLSFVGRAEIIVLENKFTNINLSGTVLSIHSFNATTINKNLFENITLARAQTETAGFKVLRVKTETNDRHLYVVNNNFTRLTGRATELISMMLPRDVLMQRNNFLSCTLSVGETSVLVYMYLLDDEFEDIEQVFPTAAFNFNHFNDTRVVRYGTVFTGRSSLIRIKAHYSNLAFLDGIFSNEGSEPIQNLGIIEVVTPLFFMSKSKVLGFSGGLSNFGNFIQIKAATAQFQDCVFDKLNFTYPDTVHMNFMSISYYSERALYTSTYFIDTNFTNISLNKTTFLSNGWVGTFTLAFGRVVFTNVDWQQKLFDVEASPLNMSFIDSVFNYSGITDQYSEPTAILIGQMNNTLLFQNTTIILGMPRTGTFLRYTGSSGGKINFTKSSILSVQAYNKIALNNNQSSNQSTSRRLLEDEEGNQRSLMKLLSIQGDCELLFNNTMIDFEGMVTPPPILAITTNLSLNIQNTTFKNLVVVPDTANSREIYSDYYDHSGKYLGGVVNVLISQIASNTEGCIIDIEADSSSFADFRSDSTGVFSILNQNPVIPLSLSISNSSFKNLSAKYGPVTTLLLPYSKNATRPASALSIANSRIVLTTAVSLGGAIFNNMSSNITISNVTSSNTRMVSAENFIYDTTGSSSQWNLTAQPHNNLVLGHPQTLNYTITDRDPNSGTIVQRCVANSSVLCLQNASSYAFESIQLEVTILDNAFLKFPDPSQSATLTLSCPQINYSSPAYKCYNGSCPLEKIDLVLVGKAYQQLNLNLTYFSEFASLTNFIPIVIRECLVGEFNDSSDGVCEECPSGNYSLNPYSPCKPCPSNAQCKGGSYIAPIQGYWRTTTATDTIYKCNDAQGRCLGGFDSKCAEGYKGPLCLQCDYENSYGASDNSNGCHQCPKSMFLLITVRFLIWILPFGYAIYVFFTQKALNQMVIRENNDTVRVTLKRAVYIDLLITYSQIMTIVLTFQGGFKEILSLLGGGMGTSGSYLFYPEVCLYMGSFECTGCVSASITLLTPIIHWFLISTFYFVYVYRFKLTWKRCRRFLLLGVTFYLLNYPSVSNKLIKLLHCTDFGIEGGESFVASDPNVSCSSPGYITFKNFVAIPALVLWSIGMPAVFMISMRCFRNHPKSIRQVFGQLINPYKDDKYYWFLGVILLKLGLIIASDFSEGDNKFRSLSMIIMLYLYKWLEGYLNPYADPKVVLGVRLSLYAYLTTIFFSYFYTDNTDLMKVICVLVAVLMNAIGLGYILTFIISNTYEKVMSKAHAWFPRFFPKKSVDKSQSVISSVEEVRSEEKDFEIPSVNHAL